MLQADFELPDGDRYLIHLSEAAGGVRLSDRGDTLMRIDSILVFSDQSESPRMDPAKPSDVGGDMVSSLASNEGSPALLLAHSKVIGMLWNP